MKIARRGLGGTLFAKDEDVLAEPNMLDSYIDRQSRLLHAGTLKFQPTENVTNARYCGKKL